jgi:hypothetical protein
VLGQVLTGGLLALAAWVMLRLLAAYHWYETDSDGLRLGGIIRRRFVAWTEVEVLTTHETRGGSTSSTLKLGRGRITIGPGRLGLSAADSVCISASAWQHLRRLGRTDSAALTPGMRSPWEEIPGDLPVEVGQTTRRVIRGFAWGFTVLFAVGLIALPVSALLEPKLAGAHVVMVVVGMILMVVVLKEMFLSDLLRSAWSVSVRRDVLQAKLTFRSVELPWDRFTRAWWRPSTLGHHALVLRSDELAAELRIPYDPTHEPSERAILATIRQLRAARLPLPVPPPRAMGLGLDPRRRGKR